MSVAIEIGLGAAIVAMRDGAPCIFAAGDALPSGAYDPRLHRTFDEALREWVEAQTGLRLGFVEQLYTFGDRGRHSLGADSGERHVVSVGYLALARGEADGAENGGEDGAENGGEDGAARRSWRDWYGLFPWEDHRDGEPPVLARTIRPALAEWAGGREDRTARVALLFGEAFDEERALDRYELLYEAGLVAEAVRDGRVGGGTVLPGRPMAHDHRRIVATAITRLRAKLKYRPILFELVPPEFTLTELQRAAEAIAGRPVHKQNFRRLVESAGLVEPTGGTSAGTGGRPAALFRFRREVVRERPATGLRIGRR